MPLHSAISKDVEIDEDRDGTNDVCTKNKSDFNNDSRLSVLSYRYLNLAWDFGPTIQSSSILSGPTWKCYHTNKSRETRYLLALLQAQSAGVATTAAEMTIERYNESNRMTMLPHTSTGSLSPCALQLLNLLKDSYSFDVIRDVRRTSCLQSLLSLPESSTVSEENYQNTAAIQLQHTNRSFHSFLLGVSSCSTAMECIMERQQTPSSTPITDLPTNSRRTNSGHSSNSSSTEVPIGIAEISELISAGCCGESDALHILEVMLLQNLHFTADSKDAVSFAVIEPVTKNLLLGRWDGDGSSIVSLPIGEQLFSLMLEWNACMQKSKSLLHRTSDSVQVAKWTDTDKREWWAERMASDALIETLLLRLELLLGPWTFLLSGLQPSFGTEGPSSPLFSADSTSHRKATTAAVKKNKCSSKLSTNSIPIDVWADSDKEEEDVFPQNCPKLTVKSKVSDHVQSETKQRTDCMKVLVDPHVRTTSSICMTNGEKDRNILDDYKVTELRQLLKDHKLSTVGKKSELITRLQEYRKNRMTDSCYDKSSSKCFDDGNKRNFIPREMFTGQDKLSDMNVFEDPATVYVRSADLSPQPEGSQRKRNYSTNVLSESTTVIFTDKVKLANYPPSILCDDSSCDSRSHLLHKRITASAPTRTALPAHSTTQKSLPRQGHTVLLLDEQLQQIPWEALSCLRSKKCSRMPSFALLLHMLTRDPSPKIEVDGNIQESNLRNNENVRDSHNCNLKNTWYALDPEGNLPATRDTMYSFLRPYIDRYSWQGFVGEMPSEDVAKYVSLSYFILIMTYIQLGIRRKPLQTSPSFLIPFLKSHHHLYHLHS